MWYIPIHIGVRRVRV